MIQRNPREQVMNEDAEESAASDIQELVAAIVRAAKATYIDNRVTTEILRLSDAINSIATGLQYLVDEGSATQEQVADVNLIEQFCGALDRAVIN